MKNLVFDLQRFAEEKTERATPKRRQEARKKGQVVKSRDLVSALTLAAGFAALKFAGPAVFNRIIELSNYLLGGLTGDKQEIYAVATLQNVNRIILSQFLLICLPVAGAIFIIGMASSIFQTGLVLSTDPITPKLNRINPLEGFKRVFSKRAVVELVKALFKICLIVYITFASIAKSSEKVVLLPGMSVYESLALLGNITVGVGLKASFFLLIFAGFDYFFQWWEHEKSLMMTKQEMKEEFKQTEGDPRIKARIKQVQRRMAVRRMMQKIPQADVIITNPEHLAVALMYDEKENSAPVVVAKGANYIAQKIKHIAKQNDVPVVENKPLAQVLYKRVEIGDIIPPELYQAVAEVLAYVYSLKP